MSVITMYPKTVSTVPEKAVHRVLIPSPPAQWGAADRETGRVNGQRRSGETVGGESSNGL